MRYKVSRHEVFSLWARQSQDHAEETHGEKSYFYGKTCYSYGSHFPIARIIEDGNVLFTLKTYSNTTSDHINTARYAARNAGLNIIYCYDIDSPVKTIEHWEYQIADLIEQISNPKNRKFDGRVSQLQTIADQFKKYIAIVPVEISFKTATALAFIEAGDIVSKLRSK